LAVHEVFITDLYQGRGRAVHDLRPRRYKLLDLLKSCNAIFNPERYDVVLSSAATLAAMSCSEGMRLYFLQIDSGILQQIYEAVLGRVPTDNASRRGVVSYY
jgi:hypothetical protein